MNFRTQVPIQKTQTPIDYNSRIVSLGSCFAENMAEKLDYFKFQNSVNPFGIIFNPVSIEKIISRIINQEFFTEKDIFFHNESWHCYDVHSDLSNADKNKFLETLNLIIQQSTNLIIQATHVIITYGTSWVYRNLENNNIVANCHKVAQKEFEKEILSVATIENAIKNTLDLIQKVNPNCHFIFTVSPVRHIKDGFVENTVSKSNLLTAIYQQLQREHCKGNTDYFPSYEIMMDELRDYRFYDQDMLHPNQVAIDYIWIKFFENYIEEKEFTTMQQVCDIQKALHHRSFNPNSQSHQQFLSKLNDKITEIQKRFPKIQF